MIDGSEIQNHGLSRGHVLLKGAVIIFFLLQGIA